MKHLAYTHWLPNNFIEASAPGTDISQLETLKTAMAPSNISLRIRNEGASGLARETHQEDEESRNKTNEKACDESGEVDEYMGIDPCKPMNLHKIGK